MKIAGAVLSVLTIGSIWAQTTVVVSGRVTDALTGLPVEGAAVTLAQDGPDGARRMRFTDEGGNYSLEDLAPGTGRVDIGAPGFLDFQKTNPDDVSIQIAADHTEHNFKLTPAASITGRIVGDDGGRLKTNFVATLYREDYTDGVRRFVAGGETEGAARVGVSAVEPDGSFKITGLGPGRYIVSAYSALDRYFPFSVSNGKAVAEKPPVEGYVQTYYPGTTEFADALPVSLAAGETRTVDFKVTKRPLFRASGQVDLPGVEPSEGTVQVVPAGEGATRHMYSGSASITGSFVVEGLPAGQYAATSIIGRAQPGAPSADGAPIRISFSMVPVDLSFSITDHDVEGLKIVRRSVPVQLGVAGKLVMANSGSSLPKGLSVQFAFPSPGGQSDAIPAADTGEFWLSTFPGDYSVQPVVPAGYAATEVLYGGANYLNSLIPMRGDLPDSSLTIVLTDQPGSATGSIIDGDLKPVPAKVVLVPDPLPANFDFRAIRVARTDDKGAFAITGLAPARYKAVVLTGDERKRDHDLALFGDRLRAADAFEVGPGQRVNINVQP